jgi:glucarate dehydratase
VPDGPGLGVTVDEDKLAHYTALNAREGDLVK